MFNVTRIKQANRIAFYRDFNMIVNSTDWNEDDKFLFISEFKHCKGSLIDLIKLDYFCDDDLSCKLDYIIIKLLEKYKS